MKHYLYIIWLFLLLPLLPFIVIAAGALHGVYEGVKETPYMYKEVWKDIKKTLDTRTK